MVEKKKSDIYNVIGKNIKKYRKRKGLKQRELAEALYLSDSFSNVCLLTKIRMLGNG